MSNEQTVVQETQHAFLVAWGEFAQAIGLIQAVQNVHLHQLDFIQMSGLKPHNKAYQ